MKYLRCLPVPFLLGALAACSSGGPESSDRISFNTSDVVNSPEVDIRANVVVEKISSQLYSLKYTLSAPVNPLNGTSPGGLSLFSMCLASKLAKQNHYSHSALGGLDDDLARSNATEVEFYVAVLNEKESIPVWGWIKTTKWLPSKEVTESTRAFCAQAFRPDFMWANN